MLKQALDFGKQILALTRDTQKNKDDIKAIQEELRDVRRDISGNRQELMQMQQALMQMQQEASDLRLEFGQLGRLVERLILELNHQKENAAKERENQELRIQLLLLRYERGLPPGNTEDNNS